MRKTNLVIVIVIVIIFAVGVGYYIYHDVVKNRAFDNQSAEPTPGVGEEESTYDVDSVSIPNLDKPVNITADLPEDIKKITEEKIEKLISDLKQDSSRFEDWLVLGIYRKMLGDLEGAREYWEYAAFLKPQSPIPFNNLGDLYANYLKDNKKAEENFLIAIKNGPDQIYIYRSFYEFYRYVMKDNVKAKQILEQGINANPNTSQDLKSLLNSF